jgi:hypothetical protein
MVFYRFARNARAAGRGYLISPTGVQRITPATGAPTHLPYSTCRSLRLIRRAAFAAGAVKRGFDMVMLTSDLSCMVAGARMQLDELKSKTA